MKKAPDKIASLQVRYHSHLLFTRILLTRSQRELENFDAVVQEVADFSGDPDLLNGLVEQELSRSKETVRKIQTFIDTSLLRNATPSRRSWVRKKGRAVQLREELRIGRNQLMLGMIALNS